MANIFSGTSMSSTSVATASLAMLSSEATSLLEAVKSYRAQMGDLPDGDPRRAVYEQIIRDLLERSRRLSSFLATEASK